jgi:hypothetical protein
MIGPRRLIDVVRIDAKIERQVVGIEGNWLWKSGFRRTTRAEIWASRSDLLGTDGAPRILAKRELTNYTSTSLISALDIEQKESYVHIANRCGFRNPGVGAP